MKPTAEEMQEFNRLHGHAVELGDGDSNDDHIDALNEALDYAATLLRRVTV